MPPVTYERRGCQTTELYVGKQGTTEFRGKEWGASPLSGISGRPSYFTYDIIVSCRSGHLL